MATINLQGTYTITDANGSVRKVNLTKSVTYTSDFEVTYAVAKNTTVVIYNTADSIGVINPWTVMMLFPAGNLDLSMGIDAGNADAAWNSIPLTAGQPFVLFRNVFWGNYVNGATTNIFGGTANLTVLKMSVKEPNVAATSITVFLGG